MRLISTAVFLMLSIVIYADSPLTSTPFHRAYHDIEIIKKASDDNVISNDMVAFLDGDNPIDQKLALINALSWGNEENVKVYEKHLFEIHSEPGAGVFDSLKTYMATKATTAEDMPDGLSADELLCWTYLQVMGDYMNVHFGHQAGFISMLNKPNSQTHNLVITLISAQMRMDAFEWCGVYTIMDKYVRQVEYSEGLMREEAIDIIFDYIDIYRAECDMEESDDKAEESETDFDAALYINTEGELIYQEDSFERQPYERKYYADLKVVEIMYPDFDSDIDGTSMKVKIKNTGKSTSVKSMALMWNGSMMYDEDTGEEKANDEYERLWVIEVPPIKPKRSIVIEFRIPDYWIYDPNIEVKIELDPENLIKEKDEKDNIMEFFAYG